MHLLYLNLNALNTQLNVINGLGMGQFHQHVYTKLLFEQILKEQKEFQVISVFFVLLGSAHVKAARKTLVKFTPIVNFINVISANFSYERCFGSFSLVACS